MLFAGCHGLPSYPVQSDLTSGSLIAAVGSISIMALVGLNFKRCLVLLVSRIQQACNLLRFTFQRHYS